MSESSPEIADLFGCADRALMTQIARGQARLGDKLTCLYAGDGIPCNGIARVVQENGKLRSSVFSADTGEPRDYCPGLSRDIVAAALSGGLFPDATPQQEPAKRPCVEIELKLDLHKATKERGEAEARKLIGSAAACGYLLATQGTCPMQGRIDAAQNKVGYAVNKYDFSGKLLDRLCPGEVAAFGQGDQEEIYQALLKERQEQANPDPPPEQGN